ncbi:XRE family transcriptional regulator [Buttiauxella warmboldiae]|uniref:XRE family transcriptional regulator n=1 Tax=Buttiauxella warmboldiae TaxID=82993 RepID=A0A3N5DW06_9ENTR|nr:sugar diacid recognition domain-containing protein [Buttiauxella warmboldiae]RPH20819.1 XRE family transcriptional regulator [Buttiauxella warmboldiae]
MLTNILREETARQIVQRTMSIIDYSVNVMSEQGVIIASGDPSRLYQRHEGAVLALTENRMVVIDGAAAGKLQGVKPGINLPIIFRQRMVGVIGISGNPEKVQAYAELVRMAAEMILEQAEMLEQNQWEKRYREQLASLLIAEQSRGSSIGSIAAYLRLDLDLPRIALIVRLREQEHIRQRELLERLNSHSHEALVTLHGFDHIVMLLPLNFSRKEAREATIRKGVRKLYNQLSPGFNVTLFAGGWFDGPDGLHRSYLSAQALQAMALSQKINQTVLYYQDHCLPVLMNGYSGSWQADELSRAWLTLHEADKKEVLCRTLRCYFEQNCDLSQTSKQLHIHVNTLRYRLQKIELITSLKINKLSDIIQLYIGMQIQ